MFSGKRYTLVKAACLVVSICAFPAIINAQCYPSLAHDSLQLVTNDTVFCSETKGDTVFIGGNFSYIGKYTGGSVPVNTSGVMTMPGHWPRVHGSVYAMEPDGSGGYYIGGKFKKVGDSVRANLAHINSSGIVTSFKADFFNWVSPDSNAVYALLKKNDKLYIGGHFMAVNQRRRSLAACFDLGTGRLAPWNPLPAISASYEVVNSIIMYNDTIYIGGSFNITFQSIRYLVSVDTILGKLTSWTPAVDGEVKDMYVDNNRLYICGKFGVVAAQGRNRVASFDLATGSLTSWNPGITVATSTTVNTISVLGNKAYLGGNFTTVGGDTRMYAASVDKYSGTVSNWNPGADGEVFKIRSWNNKLYIGGKFNRVSSTERKLVAVFDSSGNLDSWTAHANALGWRGVNNFLFNGSTVHIMGDINSGGGYARTGFAAFNGKTADILPIYPQISLASGTRSVKALKRNNNLLYIGGAFSSVNSNARANTAVYNIPANSITNWTLSNMSGAKNEVNAIEILGKNIYIGGSFTTVSGFTRNNIVAVDSATAVVQAWAPNPNNEVYVIKEKGNSIFIGGAFNSIGGQSRSMVAAVNLAGTTLPWSISNPPAKVYDIDFIGNVAYISGGAAVKKVDTNTSAGNAALFTWNGVASGKDVYSSLFYNNKVYTAGNAQHMGGGVDTGASATASTMRLGHAGIIHHLNHVDSTVYAFGSISAINSNEKPMTGLVRLEISTKKEQGFARLITGGNTCQGQNNAMFKVWAVNTNIQNPTFTWHVGNRQFGDTVNPITNLHPYHANGNKVYCIVKAGLGCYDSATTSSDTVTINYKFIDTFIHRLIGPEHACSAIPTKYLFTPPFPGAESYRWWLNGKEVTNLNSNTSPELRFIPSTTGDLIGTAYAPDTGCYMGDVISSSTKIKVIAPTITPAHAFTPNTFSNKCEGDSVELTLINNFYFGTYQWSINGTPLGSTINKITLPSLRANDTVRCIVTPPTPNCFTSQVIKDSIIINPKPNTTPTISLKSNPGDTVCLGTVVTIKAATNLAAGAKYKWYNNGGLVQSDTSSSYNFTPQAGIEVITCVATPKAGNLCYDPDTALSSGLAITAVQPIIPVITLSGPNTVPLNSTVNIVANVVNAGNNYTIDWQNNGITFATTTTNSTSYTKGVGTDYIDAVITPAGCYDNDTSGIHIITDGVGIENVHSQENIFVYPNPFKGMLKISGLTEGDKIALYDAVSRKVAEGIKGTSTEKIYSFDLQQLPAGVYLLEVYDHAGIKKSVHKLNKY